MSTINGNSVATASEELCGIFRRISQALDDAEAVLATVRPYMTAEAQNQWRSVGNVSTLMRFDLLR